MLSGNLTIVNAKSNKLYYVAGRGEFRDGDPLESFKSLVDTNVSLTTHRVHFSCNLPGESWKGRTAHQAMPQPRHKTSSGQSYIRRTSNGVL